MTKIIILDKLIICTKKYVWVEKNHITDVGVKYDGLSRRVDHKPRHWRCEDEIERGK